MRQISIALLAGFIFGAGLVISGMASPLKVLSFLTLGPAWDPSLAIVMTGALLVAVPGFAWLRRIEKPFLFTHFAKPSAVSIDSRLLIGATLFGIGWGLAGYCPGPAVVALALLQKSAIVFVPSMLLGGWLSHRVNRPR